ncbi:MAG: CDP-alcohol phosphatidyltransferase family protein [Clostridia bacterium]|nr:CDP-alcohol phosphatidyltransferase family protein [Clostridia bacterium]
MAVKELFKNWKTIPNLLSFLRIVMVPIMSVLFLKGETGWAVFVLFLSGLSDFLDGKIARRFNQISELGKVLDPIADKLTQIMIAVVLFLFFKSGEAVPELRAFSWVFLLFVGKEILMIVVGGIMILIGIKPIPAEIYGKVATFAFYGVMLLIVAFGPQIGAFARFWTMPTLMLQILVIVSVVLCFIALFSYVPGAYKQLKNRNKN